MWQTQIKLGDFAFPFACARDAGETLGALLAARAPDLILLVVDATVARLHGPRLDAALRSAGRVARLEVVADERAKTLQTVHALCEAAMAAGATRGSTVVAVGGGLVANLAGVLAGLLFRGVPLIHVPTTLLSAADAVVSLKQAVNAHGAKNSFGLYLAPSAVVVDVESFSTLPPREVRSGLAELVKNALAIAPDTTSRLVALDPAAHRDWAPDVWADLVASGLAAKQKVLADDPQERFAGVAFEYGHTVGHAVEWAAAQAGAPLSHGESVAFGMRVAARVAESMGIARRGLVDRHEALLAAAGLTQTLPIGVTMDAVMAIVALDNKRGRIETGPEGCAMVLLEAPGRPAGPAGLPLVRVPIETVRAAILAVAATLEEHSRAVAAE